jgi:hypothetical protein
MRELLDTDGENRAVRSFLMRYGNGAGVTVKSMRLHMEMCGFPHWPDWAADMEHLYLTKAGAQLWLRHLFDLEKRPIKAEQPSAVLLD